MGLIKLGLVGSAPETPNVGDSYVYVLSSDKKIYLKDSDGTITDLTVGGTGDLLSTNNLSDLTSASDARVNLGLGAALLGPVAATQKMSQLAIADGTLAGTIKPSLSKSWGGATVAAEDNLAKGGSTANFSLDATGYQLTLKGGVTLGTVLAVAYAGSYEVGATVGTAFRVTSFISGSDIVLRFTTPAGAPVDLTAEVGTGSLRINLIYWE